MPLPIVSSILEVDIQLSENEFVNGYGEGDRVLYVDPCDKDARSRDINGANTWGEG